MKVEDVPQEWVDVGINAWFHATGPTSRDDWRAALAAVIPAIQAEALERAAVVAENVGTARWHGTPLEDACDEVAAAIRALKEGT